MVKGMTFSQFTSVNAKNKKARNCTEIRILDTMRGNACGGGFVLYDNLRDRCRDEAAVQDIVDWVNYGEISVSNPGAISKYFNS